MKKRFLRCEKDGCRTLTAHGLCDVHREPAVTARGGTQPTASSPVNREEVWRAGLALADAWFANEDARERDLVERRELLSGLHAAARRIDSAGERPRFSEGAGHGI